jgi:hypothetical protein
MCTISAAYSPSGDALRLVISRDESRRRTGAWPPSVFQVEGVSAAWPVDSQAGGTWAAINAHGLAFAILNASPVATPSRALVEPITRGAIIPCLAAATDLADAERRFARGPAHWPCRPFKLIIASLERAVMLTPDDLVDLTMPEVWSTSSLGDARVDSPRRALFAELLRASAGDWQAQDRLHQHAWPDRRHLSVLMSRADACTVSRTEIVIGHDRSALRYVAIHDGWPAGIAVPTQVLAHRRAAVAA